jgi:hypothetical protein
MRHTVGNDTSTYLRHSVFCVGGDDADVGLQRDRHAEPDRVPVERRDHGLAEFKCRRVDWRRRERTVVTGIFTARGLS